MIHDIRKNVPALAVVVDAWPGLHGAIKAGILAMVKAVAKADAPSRG
jgi:hypothetical protein